MTGRRSRQKRELGKEGDIQLRLLGGQANLGGPGIICPKLGEAKKGMHMKRNW